MTSVAERLDASRRIDWKYLLGEPQLRDVTVLDPVGDDLRTALEVFADRVRPVPIDDIELRDPGEPYSDLVVVPGANARRLEQALSLVPPGGWIYAEFPRRSLSSFRDPARLPGGFSPIRRYWVHPSHASPKAFVDLGSPGPVRALVARHTRGPIGRILSLMLRPAPIRRRLGPVALVARRNDPDTAGDPDHEDAAITRAADIGPGKGALVMLTPSFSASRHVIGLIVDPETGSLIRVAKTSRLADDTQLEAEARALTRIDTLPRPPRRPHLVAWRRLLGSRWLVQSAVGGEPMDRGAVSADPDGCADLITDWLSGLDRPGSSRPADDGRWSRLFEEPLGLLERDAPRNHVVVGLIGPTRTLVEPLAHLELPVCFEHGDTRHPNILSGPDGVGLVDWELAQPEGFPLHDLAFFLEYVVESQSIENPAAQLIDPDSWAGSRLRTEAVRLGMDPAVCGPLVLLSLARRTCDHFRRAGTVGARPAESWRSCLEALNRRMAGHEVGVV